jgi:hypothetical protein
MELLIGLSLNDSQRDIRISVFYLGVISDSPNVVRFPKDRDP